MNQQKLLHDDSPRETEICFSSFLLLIDDRNKLHKLHKSSSI